MVADSSSPQQWRTFYKPEDGVSVQRGGGGKGGRVREGRRERGREKGG